MKNVNITIGRFQPITNGHLRCIDIAWKELNVPTVICMIETKEEKLDKKRPFPSSLLLPMYRDIFKGNKKIADIILVKNADIVKIGEELLNKDYNIVSWTCGTDRIDSYSKMSSKYSEQAHLDPNFKMLEVKRSDEDISATKVRQAILDDNRKVFSALTPLDTLKSRVSGEDNYKVLREQLLKIY